MILAATIPPVAVTQSPHSHFLYDSVCVLMVLLLIVVAGCAARALFNIYWEAQHIRRVRKLEHLRQRVATAHHKTQRDAGPNKKGSKQ